MKKLFIVFLSIAMFLPLYAQEEGDQPEKTKLSFARRHFEMGFDIGVGFANDFVGRDDIFTKHMVIDMNDIEESIGDNGVSFNTDLFADFYLTIMNIRIGRGRWDLDFSSGADGDVTFNLPKNLITLIAKGNSNQTVFDGLISARGGVYAVTGVGVAAEYGKLRVGVKHSLYTPMIFIPKSGINYCLDTSDGLSLTASGDISIYSPFITSSKDNVNYNGMNFGFNFSADGRYALFPFLDVGGSLTNIPFVPAKMQNRMRLTMSGLDGWGFEGQDLVDGKGIDSIDFDFDETYDTSTVKVFRPFRFDTFAHYKPFNTKLLVLTPNMGFTVDINDKEGFFNAGLEAQLNLIDMFILTFGTGREEGLWRHRLGLTFNLRVFEIDLEAALQSQGFRDSFQKKGYSFCIGLSSGW